MIIYDPIARTSICGLGSGCEEGFADNSGFGYGYGNGAGYGDGSGCGWGSGSGASFGYGCGNGVGVGRTLDGDNGISNLIIEE